MEWWQLKNFENPDNRVRVIRNLHIILSLWVDKIGVESLSPRGTTKWWHRCGHKPRSHYNILLLCVRRFSYPTCKASLPCYNLCHILFSHIFHSIWYTAHISEGIYWIRNICFDVYNPFFNIFHSKNYSSRYWGKSSNTEFRSNSCDGSRIVSCGQTDGLT